MHWFVRGAAATAAASGCCAAYCVACLTPLPPGFPVVAHAMMILSLAAVPCILAFAFYGVLTHFFGPRGESGAAPRCQTCGYNLTGNVSGICPECGEPIPDRSSSDSG